MCRSINFGLRRHWPPFFCAALLLLGNLHVVAEEHAWPQQTALQDTEPRRVLFVGNSYLYYNDSVHNHVRRLLAELIPDLNTQYKSATIGGARLSHHDLDSLLKPSRLGVNKPFQLVILQGGSAEPLSVGGVKQFQADVTRMAAKIKRSGAETALYMTHAYVAPHARVHPDNFHKIFQAYVTAGNRVGALVIPVGLAFEHAYQGRADLNLHEFFDGTHPNITGSYLAACVVLASIYRISPEGANYNAYGEVRAEDARYLQSVAWQTVQGFYAER